MNKAYNDFKKELEKQNLSPTEYERRIKEWCKKNNYQSRQADQLELISQKGVCFEKQNRKENFRTHKEITE